MRNLMIFLLVILGFLSLGAQDTTYLFQSEVSKETKITIVIPDSINGLSVKNNIFNKKASIEQNYQVYFKNKQIILSENFYPKYNYFERIIYKSTELLIKGNQKNDILKVDTEKYSGFAYEAIFIFIIAILILVFLEICIWNNKFGAIGVLAIILSISFGLYFFISGNNFSLRISLGFMVVNFVCLILTFFIFHGMINDKFKKYENYFYFGINLLISTIIALFFPKISFIFIANICGLIIGVLIVFLLRIIQAKKRKKKMEIISYFSKK